MTDYRFYRWDGLDGLVRQAILEGTVGDQILLGVTQALKRGVWVQRPADILYEGRTITRDQAEALFPEADLDAPVATQCRRALLDFASARMESGT